MKINNFRELKAEKARLRQRRKELEKAVRVDWRDMRAALSARNVFESMLHNCTKDKEEKNGNFFTRSFSRVAEQWMEKLVKKMEEKLEHRWHKDKDV